MSKDIMDEAMWAELARKLWLQMAYKPRGCPDWDMANALLHTMAAKRFDVFAHKPLEQAGSPHENI